MRGEKGAWFPLCPGTRGSPPHARGKEQQQDEDFHKNRITPACAGKSIGIIGRILSRRDHPRMRGEKLEYFLLVKLLIGSPPHARGKGRRLTQRIKNLRITPACAGKRCRRPAGSNWYPDHPRMRGEKPSVSEKFGHPSGSPPHARGKEVVQYRCWVGIGITPACAGKRDVAGGEFQPRQDHPRMRGEKRYPLAACWLITGSPPHARGKVLGFFQVGGVAGITPACAGKSPK